jgi:hypothetical protein
MQKKQGNIFVHTYLFKNEGAKRIKSTKVRVTVLCCANMKAEKRYLPVIVKSKMHDVLKLPEVYLLIIIVLQMLG